MAHVGSGHQKILVAERGRTSVSGTAVNGAEFANGIIRADSDSGSPFGIEGEILWWRPDDGAMTHEIVLAHFHFAFDDDMGTNDRMGANHGLRANHGIGTDYDIGTEPGFRIDNCGGMDLHNTPASLKLK